MLGTATESVYMPGACRVVKQASFTIPIQLPATYGTISSSTFMGYNSSGNGTAVSIASSNVWTNIQDINIPIGIWAVYYEFILICVTSGNIAYIDVGACPASTGSPFFNTSGRRRIHTPSVYAASDFEQWSSFFIVTMSAPTHLYLNIYLTYATGTYTVETKSTIYRIA